MRTYEELLAEHLKLKEDYIKEGDAVAPGQILALLDDIRNAGRAIRNPEQRDQMRAWLRYWGGVAYASTNEYPPMQLLPYEGPVPATPRERARSAGGRVVLWVVLGAAALIVAALFALPPLIGRPTPAPSADATPPTRGPTPSSTPRGQGGTPQPTQVLNPSPTPRGQGGAATYTAVPAPGSPGLKYLGTPSGAAIDARNLSRLAPLMKLDPSYIPSQSGAAVVQQQTLPVVRQLAFSPDGALLAGARSDGQVLLWRPGEGTADLLRGHSAEVKAIAFSPDGKLLASGGTDRTVNVWDVGTHLLYGTIGPLKAYVFGVAFSPDGRQLAAGLGDGTATLLDVLTGSEAGTFRAGRDAVVGMSVTTDGRILGSLGSSGELTTWADWTSPNRRMLCASQGATLQALAPSSLKGEYFVGGGGGKSGEIRLLNAENCSTEKIIYQGGSAIRSVAEGRTAQLWVGVDDRGNLIVAPASGTASTAPRPDKTAAVAVAVSPEGTWVATGQSDGTIVLWGIPR